MADKSYKCILRAVIARASIAALGSIEKTEKRCHINTQDIGNVHTIRGLPGGRMDIVICDILQAWDPADTEGCILEIGEKVGRYDCATRWRLTFRPIRTGPLGRAALPEGQLAVQFDVAQVTISLTPAVTGFANGLTFAPWTRSFKSTRWTLDVGRNINKIVLWHAERYYGFLTEEARQEAAESFILPAGSSISEANRAADRHLYAVAKQYGWRKFDTRMQTRYGVAGQWHHESEEMPGCSQSPGGSDYSHRAAITEWEFGQTG